MGLLTNANSSQGPLPTMLAKLIAKAQLLSWLMYLIGVFFIFLMPHPEYSHKTYFSENALLPGKIMIFQSQWARKFQKVQAKKKPMKSNKSISRNLSLTKFHFLWPKINF